MQLRTRLLHEQYRVWTRNQTAPHSPGTIIKRISFETVKKCRSRKYRYLAEVVIVFRIAIDEHLSLDDSSILSPRQYVQ
jgi:hypothetical protein